MAEVSGMSPERIKREISDHTSDFATRNYVDNKTDAAIEAGKTAPLAAERAVKAASEANFDKREVESHRTAIDSAKNTILDYVYSQTEPNDASVLGVLSNPDSQSYSYLNSSITDASSGIGRQVQQSKLGPHLVPVYSREEPKRQVVIQGSNPKEAYAQRFDGSPGRPFDKTVDGGVTWTQQGSLPFATTGMVKLASGTIIAVRDVGHTNPNSDAQIARSVDDGKTWSVISGVLKFPPISPQGICEGTDGSVAIAEYGNVGNTVYRIRRSVDDGLTWNTVLSSDGVEPVYDPGHFHSLTYDPVERCHLAFMDRPDISGFNGPRIYVSRDNMATWSVIATSVDWDHPNFVSPMYFKNYIAWGSDNQVNGRISRMRRDHFYSGDWAGNTEHVFQSDQKALYYTYPLREDVWMVCMNIEHISGAQDGRLGAYTYTALVVDQDGSRVSGGLEVASVDESSPVGPSVGGRFRFPSLPLGHVENNGWGWVNLLVGAMPITQGWSPATSTPKMTRDPILVQGQKISVKSAEGAFKTVATATNDSVVFNAPIQLDEKNHAIFFGSGSPEGVVTARGGSIFLSKNNFASNDTGIWVKTNPSIDKTGWKKVADNTGRMVLDEGPAISIRNSTGGTNSVARVVNGYLALTGGDGGTVGANIRINPGNDGGVEFVAGGEVVSGLRAGVNRQYFRTPIAFGNTSTTQEHLGIFYGSRSPEGVQTARGGAIYLCMGIGAPEEAGLWVKEEPNINNTGWVKK